MARLKSIANVRKEKQKQGLMLRAEYGLTCEINWFVFRNIRDGYSKYWPYIVPVFSLISFVVARQEWTRL
jgi:hypothetical protein